MEKEVSYSWLKKTEIEIRNGEKTMVEAAKEIEFDTVLGKVTESRSVGTLRNYFKKNNIRIFESGRRGHHKINTDIIFRLIQIHEELKIGVTKTWYVLKKEGYNCSHQEVADIFSAHINFDKEKPKKKEKIRCRYEVNKVNAIWHGDIYYLIFNNEKKIFICTIR